MNDLEWVCCESCQSVHPVPQTKEHHRKLQCSAPWKQGMTTTIDMKGVNKAIDSIPGDDGWWKADSRKAFVSAYRRLAEHGVPKEVILKELESLYGAVADCFGN